MAMNRFAEIDTTREELTDYLVLAGTPEVLDLTGQEGQERAKYRARLRGLAVPLSDQNPNSGSRPGTTHRAA